MHGGGNDSGLMSAPRLAITISLDLEQFNFRSRLFFHVCTFACTRVTVRGWLVGYNNNVDLMYTLDERELTEGQIIIIIITAFV